MHNRLNQTMHGLLKQLSKHMLNNPDMLSSHHHSTSMKLVLYQMTSLQTNLLIFGKKQFWLV